MIITVSVRNVYGTDKIYPADDTAALFANLTGTKTFSAAHLRVIRALGYTVHVAAGTLPEGYGPAAPSGVVPSGVRFSRF
jgi:hypothetical protein